MAEYGRYGIPAAPDETDPVRKAFNTTLGRYPSPAQGQSDPWRVMQQSESAEGKGLVDPVPGIAEMAAKYASGAGPAWLKAIGSLPTGQSAEYKGAPITDTGLTLRGPQAERNAAKIEEMVRKILPNYETATNAEKGIAYIQAKYPMLSTRLVRKISTNDKLPFTNTTPISGEGYQAGEYQKSLEDLNGPADISIIHTAPTRFAVHDTAHELTHAIQDQRFNRVRDKPQWTGESVATEGTRVPVGTPMRVPKRSMSGPGFSRETDPAGPFVDYVEEGKPDKLGQYSAANEIYGYKHNPFETQAEIGGKTATDSWDRYRNLLPTR